MSISRIYQAAPLQLNQSLRLDDKASHHLARVLRAVVGDELVLFNGHGGEFQAVITRIDKKGVDVDVVNFISREAESPVDITLAQGIARGEKMDFIVQKAVELGVTRIVPLMTERCNVRLDNEREEKRLLHWRSVIVSACEQSGRNRLPEMIAPIMFKDWIGTAQADYRFVLSPHVQNKLSIEQSSSHPSFLLLIGPEGGLSDIEVNVAMQHQFLPLNVGPRVLRTETATIAAITMLQSHFGDMK